jgi:hypothetical protein
VNVPKQRQQFGVQVEMLDDMLADGLGKRRVGKRQDPGRQIDVELAFRDRRR